jgi:flagellar L-ring protein precursor FlgH
MMRKIKHLLAVVAAVALLPACSHMGPPVQPDPNYAPVEAPPPPTTPASNNGSLFHASTAVELFRDARAYRVGDILTVTLEEQTDAETRAATSTAKNSTTTLNGGSLLGLPVTYGGAAILENFADAGRDFSGNGNSAQSNRLEGSLAVTVVRVLPNGNLEIRGEKIIGINQGTEYLRIAGLIRPADVLADNSISSGKIANARVSYGGGGALADANTSGWLARFFNSEYWPF